MGVCNPAGFWRNGGAAAAGKPCAVCPTGAECKGKLELPVPLENYWIPTHKNGTYFLPWATSSNTSAQFASEMVCFKCPPHRCHRHCEDVCEAVAVGNLEDAGHASSVLAAVNSTHSPVKHRRGGGSAPKSAAAAATCNGKLVQTCDPCVEGCGRMRP